MTEEEVLEGDLLGRYVSLEGPTVGEIVKTLQTFPQHALFASPVKNVRWQFEEVFLHDGSSFLQVAYQQR